MALTNTERAIIEIEHARVVEVYYLQLALHDVLHGVLQDRTHAWTYAENIIYSC